MNFNRYDRDERDESEQKKSRFNIFKRLEKDGPGVYEEEEKIIDNPTFLNFFKLFKRKFRDIFTINIYIVFGNFPVFFALFALGGYLSEASSAPYYQIYAPLRGVMKFENSPVSAVLGNIFGIEAHITVNTTATYILYALSALVIFTFGIINAGTTYNLRNLIAGEPVFMWADFRYAVKKNLRQGIIYGIIDLILLFLLTWDIIFFYYNLGPSMMMNIMFYISLFAIVIYLLMRFYIYLMMVTFDLSLFRLFKNGLIFSLLGFKRNILAVLGIIFIVLLNYFLMMIYLPIGIIFPFIFLFGAGSFISAYAAYPKIRQFMYPKETE